MIVVTVPAYNEEKTMGQVIGDIKRVMQELRKPYSILVVDDGSRDKTADIARGAGAKVVRHPLNYGLAEAFRTELKECVKLKADIIVHTDADGQYRAEEIPLLVKAVEEGNDLVLGSRFLGRIESMPFTKRMGNRLFSRAISNIVGMRITDAQTGFRAFTGEIAREIPVRSSHTYTQEQIIRAVKEKYKVKEVPVTFLKREGKSRLIRNPFEYAIKAWINIFRVLRDYKPLKFFGVFGFGFLAVGVGLGIWILSTLSTTGTVGGIPRVILSALFIITGVQIVLFGFLADMLRP